MNHGRTATPLETALGFRLARMTRTLRSPWAGVPEPLDLTTPSDMGDPR